MSVFDVSQTEGRELPDIAVNELTGDVERYKDFFAALEKTSPVPVGFEKIEGGSHGYYHLEEKRIAIDEGMSQLQTLKLPFTKSPMQSCMILTSMRRRINSSPALTAVPAKWKRKVSPIRSANITGLIRRTIPLVTSPGGAAERSLQS